MKHRHDSFVAIANTPEPNAAGRSCPLFLPRTHRCVTGARGEEKSKGQSESSGRSHQLSNHSSDVMELLVGKRLVGHR